MKNDPLLEIKNLHINFKVYEGILKVLGGVDFKVAAGEKVGLIGEAGCGKTTTMKSILQILASNSIFPDVSPKSEILYEGKNMLEMNERDIQLIRREQISMIFQDPTAALNPVFKVGTQFRDIIKASQVARGEKDISKSDIESIAIEALTSVSLHDPERILENYPVMLSGGMRQRICIAMALATAESLLIADEPGTSLDVTIQDQVLRLLGNLVKDRGTSIILISHALGAVRGLVDIVYTMYAGSMVEMAKTRDLFANPLHPYTEGLMRAVPKLTGEGILEGIPGRIPDYSDPPVGCRFHPRCPHMMPICKTVRPPFYDKGNEHHVACYLYKD
jgi:peptide/nickel transport system ATP-binding protein